MEFKNRLDYFFSCKYKTSKNKWWQYPLLWNLRIYHISPLLCELALNVSKYTSSVIFELYHNWTTLKICWIILPTPLDKPLLVVMPLGFVVELRQ